MHIKHNFLSASYYANREFHGRNYKNSVRDDFAAYVTGTSTNEKNSTTSKIQDTDLEISATKRFLGMLGGTFGIQIQPHEKISEFANKPIFASELRNVLLKANNTTESIAEKVNKLPDFEGRRILLAESSRLKEKPSAGVLSDAGFLIDTADNGQIAYDMLREAHPFHYDVVLMDIYMPVMDGCEATRAIRKLKDPILSNKPIIAMSANNIEADKKKALEAGADAHVTKPIDVNNLRDVLDQAVFSKFIRKISGAGSDGTLIA
jgi:CheY-like chemotaxis protein